MMTNCIKTLINGEAVKCLVALPEGYFASSLYDNSVNVWTTYDYECIHTFNLLRSIITFLLLVEDDKIVSASLGNSIIISKF
jgi:WD40 repeat protein